MDECCRDTAQALTAMLASNTEWLNGLQNCAVCIHHTSSRGFVTGGRPTCLLMVVDCPAATTTAECTASASANTQHRTVLAHHSIHCHHCTASSSQLEPSACLLPRHSLDYKPQHPQTPQTTLSPGHSPCHAPLRPAKRSPSQARGGRCASGDPLDEARRALLALGPLEQLVVAARHLDQRLVARRGRLHEAPHRRQAGAAVLRSMRCVQRQAEVRVARGEGAEAAQQLRARAQRHVAHRVERVGQVVRHHARVLAHVLRPHSGHDARARDDAGQEAAHGRLRPQHWCPLHIQGGAVQHQPRPLAWLPQHRVRSHQAAHAVAAYEGRQAGSGRLQLPVLPHNIVHIIYQVIEVPDDCSF
mmetsp:Transcript_25160/g.63844  ORF Transcript_25160/g.63844 Transcript_25160/m.63844 type:complete len:359 (-) Transcript_25160:389-1465(-)